MSLLNTALNVKPENRENWFDSLSDDERAQLQREVEETLIPAIEKIQDSVSAFAAAAVPIIQQITLAAEQAAKALGTFWLSMLDKFPPEYLTAISDGKTIEDIARHARNKARYERRYAQGARRKK